MSAQATELKPCRGSPLIRGGGEGRRCSTHRPSVWGTGGCSGEGSHRSPPQAATPMRGAAGGGGQGSLRVGAHHSPVEEMCWSSAGHTRAGRGRRAWVHTGLPVLSQAARAAPCYLLGSAPLPPARQSLRFNCPHLRSAHTECAGSSWTFSPPRRGHQPPRQLSSPCLMAPPTQEQPPTGSSSKAAPNPPPPGRGRGPGSPPHPLPSPCPPSLPPSPYLPLSREMSAQAFITQISHSPLKPPAASHVTPCPAYGQGTNDYVQLPFSTCLPCVCYAPGTTQATSAPTPNLFPPQGLCTAVPSAWNALPADVHWATEGAALTILANVASCHGAALGHLQSTPHRPELSSPLVSLFRLSDCPHQVCDRAGRTAQTPRIAYKRRNTFRQCSSHGSCRPPTNLPPRAWTARSD